VRRGAAAVLIAALAVAGGVAHAASAHKVRESETDFKFSKPHPTVSHGVVTFKLKNKGTVTHSFTLVKSKKKKVRAKHLKPGQSTTVKVRLKRGTYKFYCPVDGHRGLGMKGKVIVR
jgi:uncharacterized cupredoxin-like copper-binding protein